MSKKNRLKYFTQTQLAAKFGFSSIQMGKLLADMGLRDPNTKLPTKEAIENGFAIISSYNKQPMGVWKKHVNAQVHKFLADHPEWQAKAKTGPTLGEFFKDSKNDHFLEEIDAMAFYAAKDGEEVKTKDVKAMFDEDFWKSVRFSPSQLLDYWTKANW
jgi:hypothetical protein